MAQFNEYTADGTSRVFVYRFPAFEKADIQVSLNGINQSSGWEPLGLGGGNGGAIEFTAAPADGVTVRIARLNIPPQVAYLVRDENLADIQDKTQARANLGVYSTAQTDAAINTAAGSVQAASLQKAANLSDVADVAQARANLGVEIGVDVQAHDGDLDWVAANITNAGKAILDDADADAQRATLGIYSTTQTDAAIDAAVDAVDAAALKKAANLSDVADAAQARTNLGAAAASHSHAAGDINSGTIATARLGSGTADSSTYLRGDGTWAGTSGLGGPWEFVSSASVGTGTNFSVSGLAAGYDYLFQLNDIQVDRGGPSDQIRARPNNNATISNYRSCSFSATTGATYVMASSDDDRAGFYLGNANNWTNSKTFHMLTLHDVGSSDIKMARWEGSIRGSTDLPGFVIGGGQWTSTAAITSVTFTTTEGGSFASGVITIWRRKRSA